MGTVYRRKKYLASLYDVSMRTVDRRIDWIRAHADRYPSGAVIHCGRIPYVREDVFLDAVINGNKVDAGLAPEFKEGE